METDAAGRACMTLPEAVATATVTPSGLAAASTAPADTEAVGYGAAVAGFAAAIRKSPATADMPRPIRYFFNLYSYRWRPTCWRFKRSCPNGKVFRLAPEPRETRWLTRSNC